MGAERACIREASIKGPAGQFRSNALYLLDQYFSHNLARCIDQRGLAKIDLPQSEG